MIIKTLSRKGNGGTASSSDAVIKYIFKYILNEEKLKGRAEPTKAQPRFLIKHNVRSRNIAGMIREFDEN